MSYFSAQNDGPSLQSALNALSNGGILYLAAGTTLMNSGITLTTPNVTIRGDHMDRTIWKASQGIDFISASSHTGTYKTLEVSDITFDGNGFACYGLNFLFYGQTVDRIIVRRCRFINFTGGRGVHLGCSSNNIVEDCIFDSYGKGLMEGIYVQDGCINTIIQRNVFRGCLSGVALISPPGYKLLNTKILNNYFDGGCYTLPTVHSGSGSSISYDASSITNNNVDFHDIPFEGFIRVLIPVLTGTTTDGPGFNYVKKFRLDDSTKDFTTYSAAIQLGAIIRAGHQQTTVVSLENGHINCDGWTDINNYTESEGHSAGTSYTIYHTIIGYVDTTNVPVGTHTIGVSYGKWLDMGGVPVTPDAGSLYEFVPRTLYQVHCTQGAKDTLIQGNHVKRTWGDGISVFADHTIVTGNSIEWCQDQSITCTANWCTISNNQIYMAGCGGIHGGCTNTNIHHNTIRGWGWNRPSRDFPGLAYAIRCHSNASIFSENICDAMGMDSANVGINITIKANVIDNLVLNLPTNAKEIWCVDSGVPGSTYIRHNGFVDCSLGQGASPGLPFVDLVLPTTPAGYQAGIPGSRVICQDGNLYITEHCINCLTF